MLYATAKTIRLSLSNPLLCKELFYQLSEVHTHEEFKCLMTVWKFKFPWQSVTEPIQLINPLVLKGKLT